MDQRGTPKPVVRLKGERIVFKLGNETCELSVEEARHLSRVLESRAAESTRKIENSDERRALWKEDWERRQQVRADAYTEMLAQRMPESKRRKSEWLDQQIKELEDGLRKEGLIK
jgi:hypothetical protein